MDAGRSGGAIAHRTGLRIPDVREECAGRVAGLREVALALECGRQAEPVDRAAGCPRPEFVGVKEEQLVGAPGVTDWAPGGEAPVLLLQGRQRKMILFVDVAVRIPV